jgi:hypothetical protein
VKRGEESRPPLLLFNGIGANWELAKPFLEALTAGRRFRMTRPGSALCFGSSSQSLNNEAKSVSLSFASTGARRENAPR